MKFIHLGLKGAEQNETPDIKMEEESKHKRFMSAGVLT